MRQVAGNGQAKAGTAITAVAGAIDLVEGAEDCLLLVGGDADAGIAHGEDDAGARLVTDVQADLAALGELDGVGQQVLENLLQPLAVGEKSGRHLRLGGHLEGQPLVPGQRLEHATQAFDQAFHLGVFGAHFELAGFHLGDVENVVDQVEQVVAGRIDGFGELDLLVAEVALAVLRQQLGQDQRTVQRRAQLVGHVGEEFGLVLARTLQLLGARLQLVLGLEQFVVLAVQRLGALGQLLVGLLQFRLLGFQVGLGLLEHAGLLFELFVGGFQLFLLHLQLFVQLLGLGQHFLQALPVASAFDGDTEVATDPLQHLFVTLLQRPQEAQLQHAVDLPVIAAGHQHGTARQAPAQAGTEVEIAFGQVVQAQQPRFAHGLGQQAFVIAQHLLACLLLGIQAIAGHTHQAAMFVAHIQRADHAAQVTGEEAQDVVTEHGQGQLAEHLFGQLRLPVAQPCLVFQVFGRALLGFQVFVIATGQRQQVAPPEVGQQGAEADDEQHEGRHDRDGHTVDPLVARHAQLLFAGDQVVELLADLVGQALAAAVADQGAVITLAAAQVDHLAAEGVPRLLQGDQPVDAFDLLRVVLDHAAQALQAAEDAWLGHLVGVEETLVAGDEEATHAGFHVDRQFDRFVGIADHPVGVLDPLQGRKQVVDHRDEGNGPQQANPQG